MNSLLIRENYLRNALICSHSSDTHTHAHSVICTGLAAHRWLLGRYPESLTRGSPVSLGVYRHTIVYSLSAYDSCCPRGRRQVYTTCCM